MMPPPISWCPLDAGARSQAPRRIIVHAMAERVDDGGVDGPKHATEFLAEAGLSAHALITPGGRIIRCRQDAEGAYHAKGHNTDSLGVEFLVSGAHDYASFKVAIGQPYLTPVQYRAGLWLVAHWLEVHAIGIESVRRHSDVDPRRKVDPGAGFPWEQLLAELDRSEP
jgi:N-acetyl-anhydromuramyl-L-alanine amidase AmpD